MTSELSFSPAVPDWFEKLIGAVADQAICMIGPDGRIASWNAGAEKLFGTDAAAMIGQPYAGLFTEEDQAASVPEQTLFMARHLGRHEVEGWRRRPDGSRFLCHSLLQGGRDPSGAPLGFALIVRAAQESSQISERSLRMLIDGVMDYGLVMLDPRGIVTSWNPGAQRLKGYQPQEVRGRHFSLFYTEADRQAGIPGHALGTAAKEGRFEAEGWRVRKDGTVFWANVVLDAIRDENGNLAGFAKITRDITQRHEAQLASQEVQAQRAHAQKMDALGQLTGGVAHDFNNLLMVVNGHIHFLKSRLGEDPKMLRAAEAIEGAAERGAALTRQLLAFSRRQPVNPVVTALPGHVSAVRDMLAPSLDNAVRLVETISPDIWPIKVDTGEFELALVNLILNARDAMPNGGTLTVEAENVILARHDTHAEIEGEFVGLRLTDTGTGIAPDVLGRVFEPFFTTKPVDKGTGLGLSQVYGFTHQSGGTVTIDSLLDHGTTVTLYLPRATEAAEKLAEIENAAAPRGGSVLLVEDNAEVAEVSASMLEQAGYRVERVPDAEAALALLDRRRFDLVLSDIIMPGRYDGLALARLLRERAPDLPVLLVTGYSNRATEAATEFTVLRKPFHFQQLSQAVAQALERGNGRT